MNNSFVFVLNMKQNFCNLEESLSMENKHYISCFYNKKHTSPVAYGDIFLVFIWL